MNNLDRNALIAYVYDIYSIELALSNTLNILAMQEKKKEAEKNLLEQQITHTRLQLKQPSLKNCDRELKKVKLSITPVIFVISLLNLAIEFIVYFFLSLVSGFIILLGLKFPSSTKWDCITIGLFVLTLIVFAFEMSIQSSQVEKYNNKLKEKTEQHNKKEDERFKSDSEATERKIKILTVESRKKIKSIENKIQKLEEYKKNLENLRYLLYSSLNLIPSPYRNLRAICYLYDYLSTSQEVNIDAIFTHFQLQSIIDKLDIIIQNQRTLVIFQRRILSSLNDIASNQISMQEQLIANFEKIGHSMRDINDNQRAIIYNQAQAYSGYLEHAKRIEQNQELILKYADLIQLNTEVTAFFKRAEYLDLELDYNNYPDLIKYT